MLNNILNLEGVTVLDKKQQKEINGGGKCRITTFTDGVRDDVGVIALLPDDAYSQEFYGNQACLREIANGADRCFYDCSHDGFGQ